MMAKVMLPRLLMLVALFASSGCVTAQDRTMYLAACGAIRASERHQFDVFFVTDRGYVPSARGVPFDATRSDTVTYGRAYLDIPAVGARPFGKITRDYRIASIDVFVSAGEFLSAVAAEERQQSKSTVLIYTHGYHEGFQKSLFRFGQFYSDGCLNVVPIIFSWPSSGKIFGHSHDEDSVTFSRSAYYDLVHAVLQSGRFPKVDLMAHSMGNSLMLEALNRLELERRVGRIRRAQRVQTVVLASPDVDVDVFRELLPAALTVSDRMILLVSHKDRLLSISRIMAEGSPRAGNATNAELEEHGITDQPNFSVFRMDGPGIGSCPALGHRCAAANPQVVSVVKGLLETPPGGAVANGPR
jgi:esterase/lipase superfamily enzyme